MAHFSSLILVFTQVEVLNTQKSVTDCVLKCFWTLEEQSDGAGWVWLELCLKAVQKCLKGKALGDRDFFS